MGELILCKSPVAALPYYIENGACNIYSMEELCYFMEQNTYLLDSEFMNEELCSWIEQEQGLRELAARLRKIKRETGSLKDFVLTIEQEISYGSRDTIEEMVREFAKTEGKSDFECRKIRVDQMMLKKKYPAAIDAYNQLLASEEKPGGELLGSIWHNLGTAYARMFLFKEASFCYRNAYEWNQKTESLKEYLLTYRCMRDESGFRQAAIQNCLDETEIEGLRQEISRASAGEQVKAFQIKLQNIFQLKEQGQVEEFETQYWNIVDEWKSEYRRICRK